MSDDTTALVMRTGEYLRRQAVSCPSGEYTLSHQPDGNVVVYRTWDAVAVWATGTFGAVDPGQPASRLVLQEDGDLVVRAPDGARLWSSGTAGKPYTRLVLRDNGMLALKDEDGLIGWRTPAAPAPQTWDGWRNVADGRRLLRGQALRNGSLTSPAGNYVFTVDGTGNGRLWRRDGCLIWEMYDLPGHGLVLDEDGLLTRRRPDGSKSTYGEPAWPRKPLYGDELRVTDEGDLLLSDASGRKVWSSGTSAAERASRAAWSNELDPRLSTLSTPLIRTDFSDEAAWLALQQEAGGPHGPDGWSTDVEAVSDRAFADYAAEKVLQLLPADKHAIALVADDVNLSLANMDWQDFADEVDSDGVLRADRLRGRPEDT